MKSEIKKARQVLVEYAEFQQDLADDTLDRAMDLSESATRIQTVAHVGDDETVLKIAKTISEQHGFGLFDEGPKPSDEPKQLTVGDPEGYKLPRGVKINARGGKA